MLSWKTLPPRPLIVAHRGSSAVAPENTLTAFRQAVYDRADAVEFDVQLTADGAVVVLHDGTLDRTTNGSGRLNQTPLRKLRMLSAGAWFDPKFEQEKVPTLAEVLEFLHSKLLINIEIKVTRQTRRQIVLADRCVEVIRKHHAEDQVLVSSFAPAMIRRVKLLMPEIMTGFLYHPFRHAVKTPVAMARAAGADAVILNSARLRKRIVQAAHHRELIIGEYTVNTTRRMERSLRFGVDFVFTDNPASMRKFVLSP